MRKTLTPLGNSLALVIDKPIREVLGIARKTVLEVTTDGKRIVVIPVGLPERADLDAGEAIEELVRVHGLGPTEFAQLGQGRMMAYVAWATDGARDPDEERMRTMRRV